MPTTPDINFQNIRVYGGTQTGGFEELIAQIFLAATQSLGEFHRVEGSGGDGGVEAYAVLPNSDKIGVQSKFFDKLQTSQWKQLDDSVETAISNHSELIEYRIAVPLDRNPTQQAKWKDKVEEWNQLAKTKGFTREIKFVWQGQSELIAELTKPGNVQLLTYWLGTPQFTDEWMDRILKLAIENLDKRYSPEEHVATQAGKELSAFAHLPGAISQLKKAYLKVVKTWDDLHREIQDVFRAAEGDPGWSRVSQSTSAFKGLWPAKGIPNLGKSAEVSQSIREAWQPIHEKIDAENDQKKEESRANLDPSAQKSRYISGPYDSLLGRSQSLFHQLEKWYEITEELKCADFGAVLVEGEAGIGKSHLLAAIVAEARKRGQPALFLLGDYFTEESTLWAQLVKVIDWKEDADALLAALNQAAKGTGAPALIVLDALNETTQRNLWLTHLNAFADKMADYPNVRLILSCRSDFLTITIPENIRRLDDPVWGRITHEGLGESTFAALAKYFERYQVKANHFPPLLPEFSNPLFLRLFCETYENSTIPEGSISLAAVIETRIKRLADKLLRDIDCSQDDTRSAIAEFAEAIRENGGRPIAKEAARKLIELRSPSRESSKSLYTHLKSNGIIVETLPGFFAEESDDPIVVRFAFERFSDVFVANGMLKRLGSREELADSLKTGGKLDWLNNVESYFANRGVARALAIAIPERWKSELAEFLQEKTLRPHVVEDFLHSMVWRSAESFSNASGALFNESKQHSPKLRFETLLTTASIPNHPFNSLFLHERLVKLALPNREIGWTIPLSGLTEPYHSKTSEILRWVMAVPQDLVSDIQAKLLGRMLFWFLTSNFRGLRYRATLGAIRLLRGRSRIVGELLTEFEKVDNPYVQERMYAIACGVAMRENDKNALADLAEIVFRQVFSKDEVSPHILLREYARDVMETAKHRRCLKPGIDATKFSPPFPTKWPEIISKEELEKLRAEDAWHRIIRSSQPNTQMDMSYGDFGRYTMQSNVQHFSAIPLTTSWPDSDKIPPFDADLAQRWLIQRIQQLGWNPDRFGEYDQKHVMGRQNAEVEKYRVERIGKKYQWIALHELLGYVSDHYHVSPRWGGKAQPPYQGAWELYVRDFDPSEPLVDPVRDDIETEEDLSRDGDNVPATYPDPFRDETQCANREAWVVAPPEDFTPLIQNTGGNVKSNSEWLTLWGFYEWREPAFQAYRISAQGELKMFMHLRSWIVKEANLRKFLAETKALHFWGNGCTGVSGEGWIGEYPWGTPFASLDKYAEHDAIWLERVDTEYCHTVCGLDSADKLMVPSPQLCRLLDVVWSGDASDYIDATGELIVTQMDQHSAFEQKPCVVKRSKLLEALAREKSTLVWGLVVEKSCYSSDEEKFIVPKQAECSGIYQLKKGKIVGGLTQHIIRDFPMSTLR